MSNYTAVWLCVQTAAARRVSNGIPDAAYQQVGPRRDLRVEDCPRRDFRVGILRVGILRVGILRVGVFPRRDFARRGFPASGFARRRGRLSLHVVERVAVWHEMTSYLSVLSYV
jgi:hypothetical protein